MDSRAINRSIQRIYKDLKEIEINPLPGIGICMPNELYPFNLRANILIIEGIYESILLHMIITMPQNYPIKAPNMIIAPGQPFDGKFHHHVFGDVEKGYRICIDLLDSGFFQEGETTGWTPAYTLSTLLLQMQIFFSKQHDLHVLPSHQDISFLKTQLKKFETEIQLTDGTFAKHTYSKPFPPIINKGKFQKMQVCRAEEEKNEEFKEKKNKEKTYKKLKCSVTKSNAIEANYFMGYPLSKIELFNTNQTCFIPEILSYDAYLMQKDDGKKTSLRTSMGAYYTHFFPLYLNQDSYKVNASEIANLLKRIKTDFFDHAKNEMEPFIYMISSFFLRYQKDSLKISEQVIEVMAQISRLMIQIFENHLGADCKTFKDSNLMNELKIFDITNQKIESVVYHIIFKTLFHLPNQTLKNLIVESISEMFSSYFQKISSQSQTVFFLMDEFYQQSSSFVNTILFTELFGRKFLKDLPLFKEEIDENFGVLDPRVAQDFVLEFVKTKNRIQSFSQFLEFIDFGLNYDIDKFFRAVYLEWFFLINYEKDFRKTPFLKNLELVFQLILAFIEAEPKNLEIFEIIKKDIGLIFRFQRIQRDDSMGVPEKLLRIPNFIKDLNKEIPKYVKLLGSQEFLYFSLLTTPEYYDNLETKEILDEMNFEVTQQKNMSKGKIFSIYSSLLAENLEVTAKNMKKKPYLLMAKNPFLMKIYDCFCKGFKPLFDLKTEEKNFKDFLIKNILLNFEDLKKKLNSDLKKEIYMTDMEVMALLIIEDFKILKTTDIILRCQIFLLFEYLEKNKEILYEDMQNNLGFLSSKKSDEIYSFLINKSSALVCFDDILSAFFKFEETLQIQSYKFNLLKELNNKDIQITANNENLDFSRLLNLISKHKKGIYTAKNIELLEKYLAVKFPLEFTENLFFVLIHEPLEHLEKFLKNSYKSDKNIQILLDQVYNNIFAAKCLVKRYQELHDYVLNRVIFYDENEIYGEEKEQNAEILHFLILLEVSDQFQFYEQFFKEKIIKKYVKGQISYLWDVKIQNEENFYSKEKVEEFFSVENLEKEFENNPEDLKIQNFKFLLIFRMSDLKIKQKTTGLNEEEFMKVWKEEITECVNSDGFSFDKMKNLFGMKGKLDFVNCIKEIISNLKEKFFKNIISK